MINNKRINKIMSITLTISLLASMLMSLPARAEPTVSEEPTPVSEIKRKLMIDYLGYMEQPAATDQSPARLASVWTEDSYLRTNQLIWIGVAVDKIHDLNLFTQGIFNLEIGFDYDLNYVEPYTTADMTWEQALREANFKQDVLCTDNTYWNSTNYTLEKVLTDVNVVTDVDREDIEKAEAHKAANWKMCYVQISPLSRDSLSNTERRFFRTEDEGKQYLIRMPFRLKKVPENGEHPIVLNLTRGPTTFVIGSDEFGTMPYAAWEQTVQHNEEDDSHNLKTMFRFGGDVDLFSEYLPSITNITAFQGNPADGETAEQYNLYHDTSQNEYGFREGLTDYYIEVPNTTDSIVVKVQGAFPGVTHNENEVFVESDGIADDRFRTEKIKLVVFNPDEDIGEYDQNIIKVTYGNDAVYTLHVKRLPTEPDPSQDIGLKVTKGNPEEDIALTEDDYTTPKDFVADDTSEENPNEYWVRVDKDTDAVKIHVTASGYTVTIDGESAELTNGVATREISGLKPVIETNDDGTLKKDKDGNVIVNDTADVPVTVTNASGSKTYTVHIQRLGKGGFALNYGNSPYGEIMRAENITDKEAAKTAFISGNADGYKYSEEYLPSGIKYGASFFYSQTVWANEETNMDLDDTALFVFMFKDLVDPGFTAKDSSGNEVNPEDITRSITVKTVASENLNNSMTTRDPFTTDGQATNDTFPYLSLAGDMEARIVPGVYTLTYSFHDELRNDDVTAERNVIVLPMMGDVNIDGGITTVDANPINIQSVTTHSNLNPSDISSYNLMVYRVYDVNGDGGVTTVDVNPVNIRSTNSTWAAAGYAEYYREFIK